jgi:hypothetical protein
MVRASAIGKAFGLAAATRMFSSSCGVLKDHERLRCHAEGWAEKSVEPPAGSTVKKKGFSRMNPAGNSRSSQDLRGPPGERTNRLEQGGQFVTNPGPVTAVCKGRLEGSYRLSDPNPVDGLGDLEDVNESRAVEDRGSWHFGRRCPGDGNRIGFGLRE